MCINSFISKRRFKLQKHTHCSDASVTFISATAHLIYRAQSHMAHLAVT